MPAKSKKQQRFFGMIRNIQKGLHKGKVPKDLADKAKSIKPSAVEDYASTKHKDLPEKVDKKDKE